LTRTLSFVESGTGDVPNSEPGTSETFGVNTPEATRFVVLEFFTLSDLLEIASAVFFVEAQSHKRLRFQRNVGHGFVLEKEIDGRGCADPENAKLAEDLALQIVVYEGASTRVETRL
jgi:hypothetical protein